MVTESETTAVDGEIYHYLPGFGNELSSEVIPGALPIGRNNPKNVPYGLYTEQLSGTSFTTPRATNRRTWLYRIQPSVANAAHESTTRPLGHCLGGGSPDECVGGIVDPLRWDRPAAAVDNDTDATTDFIDALQLTAAAQSGPKHGLSIYQYRGRLALSPRHLMNTDGDLVLVPSHGMLRVETELGRLTIAPREIGVIPRGIVFRMTCDDTHDAGGYVLEVDSPTGLQLPELGPIGANGLANPRDFLHPVAWSSSHNKDTYNVSSLLITKSSSQLYSRPLSHSPYNVIAWHGNYLPYKYNLHRFCPANAVVYDHLDPSIYTVLTCPSGTSDGTALVDLVVFPPTRVLATDQDTLRPPWFHRNMPMSEYMGLIDGSYDAKQGGGFVPGGASLHNACVPHGPDALTYARAVADPCEQPTRLHGGMAFMIETYLPLRVHPHVLARAQPEYRACWEGLEDTFTGWDALEKLEGNSNYRRET